MPAPFAALEARVNASVMQRMANAQASATTENGTPIAFDVVFDDGYQPALGGMVGDIAPRATCATAAVPGVHWGSGLQIGGIRYTVTGIRPDGAGLTALTLRED